jgi:hypothetical protein
MTTNTNSLGIISIKEFAKQLGKPESTIRTWKLRGNIPAICFVTIGSTVFVKVNTFMECMGLTA